MMNRIATGVLVMVGLATQMTACRSTARTGDIADRERALALLVPAKIEIVAPFTNLKSFAKTGDSDGPDGIEVLLQARNAMGNPGLMIAGQIRVELYSYVPASANHKGRRLEFWNVELRTKDQQKSYWNRLTQMYEFRLGVDTGRIPKADRYVLLVTYRSPFGSQLSDELVLSARTAPGAGS